MKFNIFNHTITEVNFMKDTGIIRRIDELGRIVIPKEIRKNLKMNTGDNVEIYMDENHKIVLKKHSTLFGMEEELFNIAKVINELSNCSVIFTDLDKVIISYGKESEKYLDKYINQNNMFVYKENNIYNTNNLYIIKDLQETRNCFILPLLNKNSLHGFMILIENEVKFTDQLKNAAINFKKFVSKQLDSHY